MDRILRRRALAGARLPLAAFAGLFWAAHAGATAQPGTLWDNNDYIPGQTAGSGFSASARPQQNSTLAADDFFLDPADLEAARDPSNPSSCPEFRITQIRTRMFPREEIADRPWLLALFAEDPSGSAPAPAHADAAIAQTPPTLFGPVENTGEIPVNVTAVDAVWDFSGAPLRLDPGAYWIMAYKDTTGADPVGWWTPFPSTDRRNPGQISFATSAWGVQGDFDFDVDGVIVDPCPAANSHAVRGESFQLSDPSEGSDPRRRRVQLWARDASGANPLVGDPTSGGATLEVVLDGAVPTGQTYSLPATLWRRIPTGSGDSFRYRDPLGEAGPVTHAFLRRTRAGLFVIRARIEGRNDAVEGVELTPPDEVIDAYAVLNLLDGDRYCVKFGTDGTVLSDGARSFRVLDPLSEGCPEAP